MLANHYAVPGLGEGQGHKRSQWTAGKWLELEAGKFGKHWAPGVWVEARCGIGPPQEAFGLCREEGILAHSDSGVRHSGWEVILSPPCFKAGYGLAGRPVEGCPGILSLWPTAFSCLVQKSV